MTALNERTPNMPRFETVNVAVVSSSGESARSSARAASDRISAAMAASGFRSASITAGTSSESSVATAIPTLTRP